MMIYVVILSSMRWLVDLKRKRCVIKWTPERDREMIDMATKIPLAQHNIHIPLDCGIEYGVCVLSSYLFWTSGLWTYHQPGSHRRKVTQDYFFHLPSAVLALTFIARRNPPFLSLVDREVEFCVLQWVARYSGMVWQESNMPLFRAVPLFLNSGTMPLYRMKRQEQQQQFLT